MRENYSQNTQRVNNNFTMFTINALFKYILTMCDENIITISHLCFLKVIYCNVVLKLKSSDGTSQP